MRSWLSFARLGILAVIPLLVRCGGNDGSASSAAKDGGSAQDAGGGGDAAASGEGGMTMSGGDSGPSMTGPLSLPKTSGGCGMAAMASPSSGDMKSVDVGGTKRTFVLYVPMGYDPNRAYPIVVLFHGIGATGADMAAYIQMQDYSNGNAIVAFPDGAGGNWDLSGDTDLLFFDALTKSLEDTLCVNEQRVFALGFSLGAYMANHLGCMRAQTVRAFNASDGGFPGSASACGKTAALIYHRQEDDNEVVANGEKARDQWLAIDGCASTSTPLNDFGFAGLNCVQYDGCPSDTPVVWCLDTAMSPYKHDLRDVYRTPIWNWFDHWK
jgi:polyhydroxybutyrate depolymerase